MSRRALQVVNGLLGLATTALGGAQMAFGVNSPLYAAAHLPVFPILDSNLRFFGGLGLGLGLVLLYILPSIERHSALFRAVWICAFIGGVGRLISVGAVGSPSHLLVGFTILEVVGAPVLIYWQHQVAGAEARMMRSIVHVALVVRDYDEAIEFYTKKLDFTLVQDTYQPEQDKRWVLVAPPGSNGTSLLLARASSSQQRAFVGNQAGGRVFLFLNTDDFWRDYTNMISRGIKFVREPKSESYGTVAVFEDLYGNLWDLVELKTGTGIES